MRALYAFLMTRDPAPAETLLRRTTRLTEFGLREAINPSLCHCGAHMRILRAVRRGVVDPAEPVR